MSSLLRFLQSSIGKKLLMAVTGLVLFGFVFVHMLGNLQAYGGPHKLDEYGALLRKAPALLWGARLVLLASVVTHAWTAWSLTRQDWAARGVDYRQRNNYKSDYAAQTMRWGGVTLALFVVYHILHLTTGTLAPAGFVHGAVYANFVAGFKVLPVSAFYVLAMCALGLHLYHGVWSLTQTLGLDHARYNPLRRVAAGAFAGLITVVNISFPVAVLTGIIQ